MGAGRVQDPCHAAPELLHPAPWQVTAQGVSDTARGLQGTCVPPPLCSGGSGTRMRLRWRLRPLALALFACLAAGCEELRTAGKFKPDGDPAARVEPVGGGTLVVRGYQKSSRVGLISLETGERHVLELEHPSETDPGAFAG